MSISKLSSVLLSLLVLVNFLPLTISAKAYDDAALDTMIVVDDQESDLFENSIKTDITVESEAAEDLFTEQIIDASRVYEQLDDVCERPVLLEENKSILIPDSAVAVGEPFTMGEDVFGQIYKWTEDDTAHVGLYIYSNLKYYITERVTEEWREEITDLVISNQINTIGESAFEDCSKLIRVVLPSRLREIGLKAFKDCTSLNEIELPDSLTSIGYYAFEGCEKITEITIPKNTMSMGESVFSKCTSLREVTFAEGMVEIPSYALYTYSEGSVKTVNIPATAVEIGKYAFYNQVGLKNVNFKGDRLQTIGERSFSDCKALQNIELPVSLLEIRDGAFLNCINLNKLTLPKNISLVDSSSFSGCDNLTEISFAEGMKEIPEYAICSAKKVKTINLPSTITIIGDHAFDDLADLVNVNFNDCKVTRIGNDSFYGCKSLSEITIPRSVYTIGDGAFSNCVSLSKVTFENESVINSIGAGAFGWCENLQSIVLPDSLTSIGYGAFQFCTGFSEIVIPRNVTEMGENVFERCDLLTEVTFAEGMTKIPDDALHTDFYEGKVKTVNIPSTLIAIGKNAFDNQTSLYEINLGQSKVERIGAYAFYGCKRLREIMLPESLVIIDDGAFWGCQKLTEVTIPRNVSMMGTGIFDACELLTEVTFEQGMTEIPPSALYASKISSYPDEYDGYVTTVYIPATVVKVGGNAFGNQINLQTVYYGGTIQEKNKISIAEFGNGPLISANWMYNAFIDKWGEIPVELRALFNNSPKEIPDGLWYAFYDDEKAYYFITSNITEIEKTYTGSNIFLDNIYVFDGNKKLIAGTDYTISYSNNLNASKASDILAPEIKFSLRGKYSVETSFRFTIIPTSIKNAFIQSGKKVAVSRTDRKKLLEIKPIVSFSEKTLVEGLDYSYIYMDDEIVVDDDVVLDQEGKVYSILIEGKGNYTGIADNRVEVVVTSVPALSGKMKNVKIAGFKSRVPYSGNSLVIENLFNNKDKVCINEGWNEVTLYVIDSQTKKKIALKNEQDYVVDIEGKKDVGKVVVTFIGTGGFTGTISKTVTITALNAAKDFDIKVADVTYTKAGVKPDVVVTYAGRTLKEGADYTVLYKNNKKAANSYDSRAPYVKVKGKGNYKGTSDKKVFNIHKANVTTLDMTAKNVKYKANGKKGYFFVKPSFTDHGKKVSIGKKKDIVATYTYTYAEDTYLWDGSFREAGQTVYATDKLNGTTAIMVTADIKVVNPNSSYEGTIIRAYIYYVVAN